MGTVTCSFCWERGHNRRGCKHLRERMEQRIKINPNDRHAQYYFARKESTKGINKKCSYCSAPGHQRRTCKELKFAKETAIHLCTEWRKNFVNELQKSGLGVGSLVKVNRYTGASVLGMVTDIQWHKLDHRLLYGNGDIHALHVKPVDSLATRYGGIRCAVPFLGDLLINKDFIDYQHDVLLMSGVSQDEIKTQIPLDFLTGEDCVERIFKESAKSTERLKAWEIDDWCKLQGFYK